MARRRIEDVGEQVLGLRKDRFKGRLTVEQLRDLSPEEAQHFATKDDVWAPPDYAALVAGGMPPAVAAFVKIARDRMAAKPDLGRDPALFGQRREDYVRAVGLVRDGLLSLRRATDGRLINGMLADAAGVPAGDRTARTAFDRMLQQVAKDRSWPHVERWEDLKRIEAMIAEGFPGKVPAWRRGVEVRDCGDGFVLRGKRAGLSRETFPTAQAAHDWLERDHAARKVARSGETADMPSRPHLDGYARTGLVNHRGGRDVDEAELMAVFGFRGVKFGNWLPNDERQAVVNMGYDALCDLADVMGLPRSAMSLDGRLAVAFGAMGNGGAAATYHPGDPAINMTRLNGAGCLAHEWGHAFDHWSGEVGRELRTGVPEYGSGHRTRTSSRLKALSNLSSEEALAWDGAMSALWSRPTTKAEAVTVAEAALARSREEVAKVERGVERQMGLGAARRDGKWLKAAERWLPTGRAIAVAMASNLEAVGARPEHDDFGRLDSDYLREAGKLSGGTGDYYLRPTEMFARAFECHVFDRLAEAGAANPYLVHGVEAGRYAGPDYRGDPYPKGAERVAIAAAMDALAEAMRHRLDSAPAPAPA